MSVGESFVVPVNGVTGRQMARRVKAAAEARGQRHRRRFMVVWNDTGVLVTRAADDPTDRRRRADWLEG